MLNYGFVVDFVQVVNIYLLKIVRKNESSNKKFRKSIYLRFGIPFLHFLCQCRKPGFVSLEGR